LVRNFFSRNVSAIIFLAARHQYVFRVILFSKKVSTIS
jgi:hypothetical protein